MIVVNARFLTQPLTGVQRYAFEVSMQIKKLAPDTLFVTPAAIRHRDWAKALNAQELGPFTGHCWEQITLARFMKKQKKAVLFSPANTGPLFIRKQFITLHDLAFRVFPADHRWIFRTGYNLLIPQLLHRISGVFTVSETIKQEIVRTYKVSATKVQVSSNGLGMEFLASLEHEPTSPKENLILCVGTLSPRKQTQKLVEAFIESQGLPSYQLILLGKSSGNFQQHAVQAHPRIRWIPDADDDVLISYYRRAKVCCCLSAYEGFGLPVLEALAFGCATVCSAIPVFRELYSDYVTFCNPDDRQDIIDQLEQVTLHKQERTVPLEALLQQYNYAKAARQVLDTLLKT